MSKEPSIRAPRGPFPAANKERSEEFKLGPKALAQDGTQMLLGFGEVKDRVDDLSTNQPRDENPSPVVPTGESPIAAPVEEARSIAINNEVAPPIDAPLPTLGFSDAEPLQARMLNEFVYCQRLFYYEFVEGVFVESADTARGTALHTKADKGRGDLPAPDARQSKKRKKKRTETPEGDPETPPSEVEVAELPDENVAAVEEVIHSRSASMGSERLGVVAKMDLIEVRLGADAGESSDGEAVVRARVTPVEYKLGSPRLGADANELWDTDKIQLGLQMLILRDNGYLCDEGVIFYRGTKQRVPLPMTPELETWIVERIAEARRLAISPEIPPPLVNSPKCVRCSLAPVCLPDETRLLALRAEQAESQAPEAPPRRLLAARDDERALYLNTPGVRVGVNSGVLVVKDGDSVVDEVRMGDVTHVSLFGNVQISTQAVHELCEREIPVAYFSMGGWFYGLTRGHGLKNVFTRICQFEAAGDRVRCLTLAQRIVQAKIRNHRTLLMRLHVQPPATAVRGLRDAAGRVPEARSFDELLGMEGAAAALYFQNFGGMIKIAEDDEIDELPGLEKPEAEVVRKTPAAEEFKFDFTQRRRRPPTDPVNALLSLAYSLLAKDCTIAALAAGFDPYVGFYHQPRHGRPALALDLMEEFRPLIAESAVLTAINNRMIQPGHFVRAGNAVNLTKHGRKAFFHAYEQRMNAIITHPVFDYKVSYRRVIELQARLLARHLTGEIPEYVPMITR